MSVTATIDLTNLEIGVDQHAAVTVDVTSDETAENVEIRLDTPAVGHPYAEAAIAHVWGVLQPGTHQVRGIVHVWDADNLPASLDCEVIVHGPVTVVDD